MLAIDWAYTKLFAVCNGSSTWSIPWKEVLSEAKRHDKVVIEHGAPLTYLYDLVRTVPTYTVPVSETNLERVRLGIEKRNSNCDLVDAEIIYNLFSKDGLARLVTIDDDAIKLSYLYHQYIYLLRAKVSTNNQVKGVIRHFGDTENLTMNLLKLNLEHYDENLNCLKKEIQDISPAPPEKIAEIKGIGKFLWAGILVFANPELFDKKPAYRVWCGLVNRKNIGYKFNRNASRIYYLCVDSFIKHRTPYWRELYDDFKKSLTEREDYTHPHGGAMNRVMTKFANFVFDVVKFKV